ncbi:heme ABC transporter ATP-binding protein [Flavobacterium haoranii]|uniref:Iron complex transport system ATP-binding protein n=1 Tax=Flavobacterium haoranii TaxID=683124 RepID=A0A1M6J012_9FLAO|nr:heme ABC transporter ATP-binding protein [Flavobacterium haoranii]SHJ40009.1 iron complex transport system ATP-binding protein [Flavobacterium haoranii]
MLTTKNLSVGIANKVILENVSEAFEAGKISLIIGPNGAGKSTFIKAICGQLKLNQKGTVDYDTEVLSISELAKVRAVLSQNSKLNFPLTVRDIVMMGRYPHFNNYPSEKDKRACNEAIQFFELENFIDRNYLTLSGGEMQRVHFARVLAQIWFSEENKTRYLILDEPLTFLDVHFQYSFMYKMQELAKENNIVIIGVLHDLNLTAKFADKIMLLSQGKVIASGNKTEVLTKENILEAFKMEAKIHTVENEIFIHF